MFLISKPEPPVRTDVKVWIERRLKWLARCYGVSALSNAVVVRPSATKLPVRDGSLDHEAVYELCRRWIGAPVGIAKLALLDDETDPDANLGGRMYGRMYKQWASDPDGSAILQLGRSLLREPDRMAAACLSMLALRRLALEGRISGSEYDLDARSELLAIFLGAGAFIANATIVETTTRLNEGAAIHYISRMGALSAEQSGYAMAVCAWVRREPNPEWRKDLCPDARGACEKGLRYLQRTGNCVFSASPVEPTRADLIRRLREDRADVRCDAAYDVCELGFVDYDVLAALTPLLKDVDDAIPPVVVDGLAAGARHNTEQARILTAALDDADDWLADLVIGAIPKFRPPLKMVACALSRRLKSSHPGPAAAALTAYGREAAGFSAESAELLRRHFHLQTVNTDDLCALFCAIHEQPLATARRVFSDDLLILSTLEAFHEELQQATSGTESIAEGPEASR